jgi:predicted transcriptional regulator
MSISNIRIDPEIEQALDEIAARFERSRNWVINRAVREFVRRHENEETRWKETLGAFEDLRAGNLAPAGAVHEWLASWGSDPELVPPVAAP